MQQCVRAPMLASRSDEDDDDDDDDDGISCKYER